MKHLILAVVLALGLCSNAFAANNGLPQPTAVRDLLNYGGQTGARAAQLGTQVVDKKVQLMKAYYQFGVQGGAVSTVNLKDVDNKDAVIPNKAIVNKVLIDCYTAVTSAGAATIAFGMNTTTDLLGATAKASLTGILAGTPIAAASAVKATAQRTLTATIGTAAVTAGKCTLFVEYVLSDT